jgi:hypothetical protein
MSVTVPTERFAPYQGKPDKERLLATYRGDKTDRVPNFEVLIESEHVKRILGRAAGDTLGVGGEVAKGAGASEAVQRPMHPQDYIELCTIIGQDCICLECMWTPIYQRAEDGTMSKLYDRSFKSRADLERVVWPGETDMERTLGYLREYVQAVEGTSVGVCLGGASMFQTLYEFVIGMHDCMIMTVEDPELLEVLMQRSADYYEELFRRAVAVGLDAVGCSCPWPLSSASGARPTSGLWPPSSRRASRSSSTPTASSTRPWRCSSTWGFPVSTPLTLPGSTIGTTKSATATG